MSGCPVGNSIPDGPPSRPWLLVPRNCQSQYVLRLAAQAKNMGAVFIVLPLHLPQRLSLSIVCLSRPSPPPGVVSRVREPRVSLGFLQQHPPSCFQFPHLTPSPTGQPD